MSYQKRNTIILSIFLLLIILVGGFFNLFQYPAEKETVQKKIKRLEKNVKSLKGLDKEYQQLQALLHENENKLAAFDKAIKTKVTTASTYNYLNLILNEIGFLEFNIRYTENKNSQNFGYRRYYIKGEGPFSKIYKFIYNLERGPQIYKVKNVTLRSVESIDPENSRSKLIVPFSMEIWAYYVNIDDLPSTNRTLKSLKIVNVYNPFNPSILRKLPPNTDGLLEVERAELKALVPDKVLVADYKGKIHTLQQGDKVYLGYLTNIDQTNNQAIFTLNKGGLVEKIVLELHLKNTINIQRR